MSFAKYIGISSIMEKSGDSGSKGFFFGTLMRTSSPSASLTGVQQGELSSTEHTKELSHASSPSPTSSHVSPLPLQRAATNDSIPGVGSSGAHVTKVAGVESCYPQKIGYRQCLELNPDDKANCTWALDNYLKCKEQR